MDSFSIAETQLARLACALTGDELARNFNHYTDFLTRSEWNAQTQLGLGGLDLSGDQISACAERFCHFFNQPADAITVEATDTFGDWAEKLAPRIHAGLKTFRFLPATHGGAAESRHAADEIWQDARVVASLMHGRRRVITMVSTHSLFGFVTSILAPQLQHLPVIEGGTLSPDELSETLSFGDLLIATPTLWRYLAQTLPSIENNVMGVSFGEPLQSKLATELRKKGLGAMRELYGSTETGIIGWRDSPSEPFVLFDHWSHDKGRLVRSCPKGELREMASMDHMSWTDERAFTLSGRRDGAVQIGAVNVFPNKISEIVTHHPDVKNCTVRVGKRSGTLNRLVAHIELEEGRAPDQDMAWKIDEWCRNKLRPQERPRIYTFGQLTE